ncbi:UvrD-helicase domain-containing protein [Streptomyces aidingensis]|uniref:DNA 3'-5' helicase n=1 Tax=Streptomyces aidingensis TaxID=910347 RepID=A0A1I1NJI4_9ACTN|nr:UvrD-helicase domain-containing protein [Streptomyces aidingensis]SFC97586.1 TIGR00375 family protein [Streptomyces aidingensis]
MMRPVRFHADLHIHSKFSRACSKDCDLEHLTWWARRKGITLVGTGDFTHPAWFAHLRETLEPAEPGLFRLRRDLDRQIDRTLPGGIAGAEVRFMLSVEISTIYKRGERTRKIHHLVYQPDFASAEEFSRRLGKIGNLGSDGRPILGLDSRDLLEITLESGNGHGYLVPAHVWTPWFAVLGSKAGFDRIEDCYLDLAHHIFALETGLSSDPAMNWRISGLDGYRMVSNSDAHSPPMLGRETTLFDTGLDFWAVKRALETGRGHLGSVEFFPEEGKYHVDGHRKCGVRMAPAETRAHGGRCPECGRPLTVGVLSRVEELADRPEGHRPAGAPDFVSLVPLPEIMGEILSVGPKSKTVRRETDRLTAALGPELAILERVPVDDIGRHSPLLAEAVARLRRGEVIREAGYDGEYGVIRMFEPAELRRRRQAVAAPGLFEEPLSEDPPAAGRTAGPDPAPAPPPSPEPSPAPPPAAATPTVALPGPRRAADASPPARSLLDGLDPEQRAAAEMTDGPLLIVAGPGTGKTRTLTHRLAHLVTGRGAAPEHCLAITFTRRAAEEMADRLAALAPRQAPALTVATFHSLGLSILREQHERAGLRPGFAIADEAARTELAAALTEGGGERQARRLLSAVSRLRRTGEGAGDETVRRYTRALRERNLADFDDLVALPVELLSADPALAARYRDRYRWISVDEYQDVDEQQYRLLRLLTPPDGNLTAIGDPDQAIYRFRGADVGFFLRFRQDFPAARTVRLTRNYRSAPVILSGATQLIAPATLVPDRVLRPMTGGDDDNVGGGGAGRSRTIGLYRAANERAEASFVARTIEKLLGGASFHSLDSGRVGADDLHGPSDLSFSDFAVLYRTDRQAQALVDGLTVTGLPFQKRSHDRLAGRPGVAAVLAALPAVTPPVPAPPVPVAELLRRAAEHARAGGADPGDAVGLLAPLAGRCGEDLERFHAELALGVEVDTWDPRADRISLLTLHAAKGLEFPVVFVTGCEEGLLPLRLPGDRAAAEGPEQRRDREEQDREERRLLFVGMTRARRRLFLTHAAERTRHGTAHRPARSPFLDAVRPDVLRPLPDPPARRAARAATQLRLL